MFLLAGGTDVFGYHTLGDNRLRLVQIDTLIAMRLTVNSRLLICVEN